MKIMKGAIASLIVLSSLALAQGGQGGSEFGKREYDSRCAGCHGVNGKGDGIHKPYLDRSPADLTVMAKHNGGKFPYMHFYAVVDGRFEGGRDMPCFADVYREAAAADYLDVPYETDQYLDTRLTAIARHLSTLQEK